MENAVVYARYSSHSQTEQSIEGQISAAKKYASDHDYQIVHEYIDRAKTGTNDNREAFQRMLKDCSRHSFTVIIVWKVDRFGRNREEIAFNKHHCRKHGVRVEYVAENISSGPEGVILESVLEGMAEYYSLQLSQNIRRGMLERAKKHLVPSGSSIPFGFKMGEDGKYKVDEMAAPTVRKVFELYAEGYSMAECTRYLNENGYVSSKGKPLSKNSIRKVLSNERYAGTYVFRNIIRDENAIPQIVSKELFSKVQEMLKVHRKSPAHSWIKSEYVLTPKLFCGACGGSYVGMSGHGKSGAKYNYYTCLNRRKGTCTNHVVNKEALEETVFEGMVKLLNDDSILEYLADITWEYYRQTTTEVHCDLDRINHQIETLERAKGNLLDAIQSGLPYSAVKDRMEQLSLESDSLKEKKASLEYGKANVPITKEQILAHLKSFKSYDKTLRKRLLDVFINKIFVYGDHITIAFNYLDSTETITLDDLMFADDASEWSRGLKVRTLRSVFLVDFSLP